MENMPIIRLEIEGMKHSILKVLSNYKIEWDKMVRESVEYYCSEDNLKAKISEIVRSVIDKALETEITEFYMKGKGREVIKEVIDKKLSE